MTITSLSPLAGIPLLGSSLPSKPVSAAGVPDFASVLADMASQAASSIKTGDDMAIKGIQGQVPVQDVVQAVMKAQTSLQTAQAIRDKVVATYQELTRMSI